MTVPPRPIARVATLVILATAKPIFAQTERYDDSFRKYSKRYFGPGFDWRLFKAQEMAKAISG